ncbi:uncharacterized protein RCO7_14180 [Rhynchosporium graminicola]|uniref:Uncharacterized protein n=1 Tax=Rhynchosporium graminicola TaxID=2792576 RepID=A0A1E1JXI6_9HELO|nr:uncharacterized protein RCO7_14180 [Rhynchosporium commune]
MFGDYLLEKLSLARPLDLTFIQGRKGKDDARVPTALILPVVIDLLKEHGWEVPLTVKREFTREF